MFNIVFTKDKKEIRGQMNMDDLKYKLLTETVRFIEFCQELFLKEKLQFEEYKNLTSYKFKFISNVYSKHKRALPLNDELHDKINKLYLTECFICNRSKEAIF